VQYNTNTVVSLLLFKRCLKSEVICEYTTRISNRRNPLLHPLFLFSPHSSIVSFLECCSSNNIKVISGSCNLIYNGSEAFGLWTNRNICGNLLEDWQFFKLPPDSETWVENYRKYPQFFWYGSCIINFGGLATSKIVNRYSKVKSKEKKYII
jgi:hypothetical protein